MYNVIPDFDLQSLPNITLQPWCKGKDPTQKHNKYRLITYAGASCDAHGLSDPELNTCLLECRSSEGFELVFAGQSRGHQQTQAILQSIWEFPNIRGPSIDPEIVELTIRAPNTWTRNVWNSRAPAS